MVRVDVIAAAGAVLTGLAITAPLASAVTPTDHIMRALATSSSSVQCAAEGGACAVDGSCTDCLEAYGAQTEACSDSAVTPTDSDLCGLVEDLLCCAAAGCENNAAFVDLIGCAQTGSQCPVVDISTCAGGGGGSGGAGSGSDVPTDPSSPTSDGTIDTSPTTSDRGITPTSDGTTETSPSTSDRGIMPTSDGTVDTSPSTSDGGISTAYGTTSMNDTSSSTSSCLAEAQACLANAACASCIETTVTAGEACQGFGYDPETATCNEKSENACCALEEAGDCLSDNLLVAFLDCAAQDEGCVFSATDCGTATSGGTIVSPTTSDGGTTTSDGTIAMDDTSSTPNDRGIPTSDGTVDASSTTSDGGITTSDGTVVVPPTEGGITTSDGTTTMDDVCQSEGEACLADSECLACLQSVADAGSACVSSDFDDDAATCDEGLENVCCAFEEAGDCLSDDSLVAWLDCLAQDAGCDVSITDCADGGAAFLGSASATPSAMVGGTTAVLSAAAVLLAFMNV